MPATTRYSATFDRPYEEDDRPAPLGQPLQRRSRSLSLQAPSGTSLLFGGGGGGAPGQRSSSTDGGGAKEPVAGRTAAKAAVKAHSNPFQFVKVGTCPLYKKAEQQLKKVKEVKKSEVLQEEEEEWQSNLDSWKTRRRKMSEDVFKRQEEIKQFEVEEQENQISQKKTKTFSEMVESRATRGRALSLCLISSPLEFQDWEPNSRNGKKMCSVDNLFSGGSEESSNVNSEDETGVCVTQAQNNIRNGNTAASTNGTVPHQNGTSNHNNEESVAFKDDQGQCGNFIDSGLESISSHRAGDIPDSGSDFSQDSGGSMDCESPRVVTATSTGVAKLLEEFNSQSETAKQAQPVHNGVHASKNGILPKKENKLNTEKNTSVNGTKENINKRTVKATINGKSPKCLEDNNSKLNKNCDEGVTQERSIESENEMYVDDFEELSKKVHLPISAEISSTHSPKDPSSLPKEGKASETSPAVKNHVSYEISSVSSPKTSNDSNSTITDKQELKCTEPKPQLTNDTGKAIQKKPKKSPGKLIKKPVNNSKASNEPPCETTASTNSNNRSLNIIYQSQNTIPSKSMQSPSAVKNLPKTNAVPKSALNADVPTVEKVAEEMEKMILEQLEEEERAKELASKVQSKDTVIAKDESSINSVRQLNPPKEKPPPPPQDSETKKVPSLNRASSTKRIKKEIHKRRSNFLGIENEDENSICDGSSVPPPPALEDILKAEMEIDREGRKQIENAAIQRLSIEECEIMRKEREIIENLEIEERRKRYMGQFEDLIDPRQSIIEANANVEAERIQCLKEERILNEEQKMRLEEERYLKEREEYIRKQEGDNTATLSSSLIPPDTTTTAPTPDLPTSLTSTKPNTLLLEKGDGEIALSDSIVGSKSDTAKPIVPPKPLKKKEVIRKERERLRQEQEALQREREEHRQKLLMEQELMKNAQKSHAVDACRLGPPPPAKPTFTPQLTPLSALPSNTATSRTHNGIPANTNSDVKRVPGHTSNRQSKAATSRSRATPNESWGQQKVPSVKKQNDSLTESRYNQNHWLLHEAEMRRLTELNDRQSQQPYHGNSSSQAHLPQDDACSTNPKLKGPHINYAEHMWNYGGQPVMPTSNGPVVKYPAPVIGERAHVHASYPRKPVLEPPTKPSRVVPMERQEHMLSVSGRKRCSHCTEELGRGAAMIIESLQLYYHIQCFQCCVCQAQLGNGSCGTDVRVRNNKLHCQNCYSNDEAGLKFSQV